MKKTFTCLILATVLILSSCTSGPKQSTPEESVKKEDAWICANCGQENTGNFCNNCGEKKPDGTEEHEEPENETANAVSDVSAETVKDTSPSVQIPVRDTKIKESPNKYTFYIKDYVGRNAASVGYTSLGGARYDKYGAGLLKVIFVSEDGAYVDLQNEDNIRQYVVIDQSLEPNTELKFAYDTDENGNESDYSIDDQNYTDIQLLVKNTQSNLPDSPAKWEAVVIPPSPDKSTWYMKNYVGLNLETAGYTSMGGNRMDQYGDGFIKLVSVTDDGTYIDPSDHNTLKSYIVTSQSIEPGAEIHYEYSSDFDFLIHSQNISEIDLHVTKLSDEVIASMKLKDNEDASEPGQEETKEDETDPEKEEKPGGNKASSSADDAYKAIYDEYSQKIIDATPGLIEKYNEQSKNNTEGITGLATISTDLVQELAGITQEGVEKMAQVMLNKGTGKYEEYSDWAEKLYDVYNEEAEKIMDAYINSAF